MDFVLQSSGEERERRRRRRDTGGELVGHQRSRQVLLGMVFLDTLALLYPQQRRIKKVLILEERAEYQAVSYD